LSPWDTLPVSAPETVHDWAAFRDLHRLDLSGLDLQTLAVLYGFSSLVEFRDEDCLQRIEHLMDAADDPVRARYDLAWNLGESFDEHYYRWHTVFTPEEKARLEELKNGAFGPVPFGRPIQPEEPGYVSEIPAELHDTVVQWLVAGIERFRDDEDLFQHVRSIAARALAGDTFLDDADIAHLRLASDDELTLRTDKRAQKMLEQMTKDFNDARSQNKDGTAE
jgi:hypothetical protein